MGLNDARDKAAIKWAEVNTGDSNNREYILQAYKDGWDASVNLGAYWHDKWHDTVAALPEREKLKAQLDEAIALLNKIGIMGMGEKAYHRDFTTEVNGMVRAFLKEIKK